MTGGTNGIGVEIVRALAKTGMKVFFTSRSVANGERVVQQLQSEDASLKLEVVKMELKSLKSVKKGAEVVQSKTERLDVLINNAGKCCPPVKST